MEIELEDFPVNNNESVEKVDTKEKGSLFGRIFRTIYQVPDVVVSVGNACSAGLGGLAMAVGQLAVTDPNAQAVLTIGGGIVCAWGVVNTGVNCLSCLVIRHYKDSSDLKKQTQRLGKEVDAADRLNVLYNKTLGGYEIVFEKNERLLSQNIAVTDKLELDLEKTKHELSNTTADLEEVTEKFNKVAEAMNFFGEEAKKLNKPIEELIGTNSDFQLILLEQGINVEGFETLVSKFEEEREEMDDLNEKHQKLTDENLKMNSQFNQILEKMQEHSLEIEDNKEGILEGLSEFGELGEKFSKLVLQLNQSNTFQEEINTLKKELEKKETTLQQIKTILSVLEEENKLPLELVKFQKFFEDNQPNNNNN